MKPKQEMYKDLMMGSTIEQKSKNTNTIEAGNGSNLSIMNVNEEPYGHLKARNVFKDLAEEFQ